MLFSYGSGRQRIDGNTKWRRTDCNIDCYGNVAVRHGSHPRWSTPRASLEATRCRHWSGAYAISPQQPPWSKNLNQTHKSPNKTQLLANNNGTFRSLVVCENFNPKTDPLLSSLMQWALCKCEVPRLELESSAKFLAINRCQRTKFGKVIKLAQSSI